VVAGSPAIHSSVSARRTLLRSWVDTVLFGFALIGFFVLKRVVPISFRTDVIPYRSGIERSHMCALQLARALPTRTSS